MLYRITTDAEGFVLSIEQDEKGIEIDPSKLDLDYLNCYKLNENKLVLDEEKYNAIIASENKDRRISELIGLLADTDYIQDGLIIGLLQLKNPVTFITDLIALLTSTLTEYPAIIAQRSEWIAELKSLKK